MATLWSAADVLRRDRLNRGVIVDRLFYPLYDENQAGSVTLTPVPIDGDDIASGETTHYTAPSSGVTVAAILNLRIANAVTTRRQTAIHIVPSGGSRQAANQIWADYAEIGNPVTIVGPWFVDPSDTLRSISADASANDVALVGTVLEYADHPQGLTLKVVDGVLLTNTAATYYTAPAGQQAIPVCVTLCNQDTSPHVVTVRLVPSGQATAARYTVLHETLAAKQSRILALPFTMDAGDFISALADANSVVSIRPTVLEVA